ncbi:DNA-directed RNA polymerase III, subunit Rpc31 [Spinellus fusiger]|nr:DNA-directed RNA polymerase III, subunit Rpc31 [Spinellus fusiger]
MSRGGRGGFGGGRGGFGGANSGAMQLVSFDMLKDLGSGGLFNVNTALFPELDVPIPRKPTETETDQYTLKSDFIKKINQSAYYLKLPEPKPDIERYSDKYKKTPVKRKTLREIETDFDFFSEELHATLDSTKGKRKRKIQSTEDDFNLDALLNTEEKEDNEKEDEDDENKEKSDAELEEEMEEEEELVDDNDYGQNYFDNGEDDYDDDDGN